MLIQSKKCLLSGKNCLLCLGVFSGSLDARNRGLLRTGVNIGVGARDDLFFICVSGVSSVVAAESNCVGCHGERGVCNDIGDEVLDGEQLCSRIDGVAAESNYVGCHEEKGVCNDIGDV